MANQFDDIRLPDDVEAGAHGGPEFMTTIVAIGNGTEQRNIDWASAKASWDIGYGIQDQVDYKGVRDFFYARRGKAVGFRFKDWSDYQATDELIALGDGANLLFQLVKNYTSGSATYVRKITRPVTGTLVVRVNGVVKTVATHYNINYATGLITFTGGNAPGNGLEVRVDYEFDIPVRFDVDKFDLRLEITIAGAVQALPIVELRE